MNFDFTIVGTRSAQIPSSVSEAGMPPMARAALAVVATCTLVAAAFSPSAGAVVACGCVLCIIIVFLWRQVEPPILLLPALFQWSEVSIWPYATALRGTSLNEQSGFGADLETSTIYGLLGVLALAAGMRLGCGRVARRSSFAQRLRSDAQGRTFSEVARLAMVTIAAGYGLAATGRISGGLLQVALAFAQIKYIGIFVLCYWCLYNQRGLLTMCAVVGSDVIFGLTGFFAQFKDVILTVFIAALAARPRIQAKDAFAVGVAGLLILNLAIFWSAIKPDYRVFLNQGSGAQEVVVPVQQRLAYLVDRSMRFDGRDWSDGLDHLIDRHGYTDFLALVMANVPANREHENGRLTWQAATFFAIPRLIWPAKPPLPNDTDVMAEYTGLPDMWADNTSISIGYLGDLYIDFGWLGGLLATFGIGACVGRCYRNLSRHEATTPLISSGLCVMLILPVCYFGTAYIKLFGALAATIIAVFFVQRCALPLLRRLAPSLLPV